MKDIQKIAIKHGYEPPYKADREWLIFDYLPKLEGSILYVGVNTYNNFYSKIVKDPNKYFTIDICPERSKKGSNQDYPKNNFVENLKSHNTKYDNVCLFGIHGFNGYKIYNEDTYLDLIHVHDN